jgi:hypothetical protein
VLVTLAVLVAAGLVLTLTGNNPVGWVQEKWRELTVDLVPVEGVTAAAVPPGTVAPGYDVGKIPDPRRGAWATEWSPDAAPADSCGDGPAAGGIRLRWDEPTRVRGLHVWAGLSADSTDRAGQNLPMVLSIAYGDDQCLQRDLDETPERQTVQFDTEVHVKRLRIEVDDVHPRTSPPTQDLVAIGGIEVLHQPE